MIPQNTQYLIALSHFPKFGPIRLKRLKKYFLNYEKAFQANTNDLIKAGIEPKVADEFVASRSDINIEKIINKLADEDIKILTVEDKKYPKLLLEIYHPPQLLYIKGNLNEVDEFSLSVVGTRKNSPYGKQICESIVRPLAQNRLTIISGLALGIDTIAHNACLDAGGRTIAVLGTGIDEASIYPSANRFLAKKIIDSDGLVISEFPLGTQPLKFNFPQRNRIISGLSLGTLVIEAGERSGALITAASALEQNRDVFAVPGNVFSATSIGPNKLIKQGARTVTDASDIIEALDLRQVSNYIDNKKIIPETKEEELILKHLNSEALHVDELIRLTKIDTSHIIAALTLMEMKGKVKNLGNMQYVLAR